MTLDESGVLQAILMHGGHTATEAARWVRDIETRGPELAAFWNIEQPTVLSAVKALLRGETWAAFDTLGVYLNPRHVAYMAVELGFAESKTEVSNEARLRATVVLFLQETSWVHKWLLEHDKESIAALSAVVEGLNEDAVLAKDAAYYDAAWAALQPEDDE